MEGSTLSDIAQGKADMAHQRWADLYGRKATGTDGVQYKWKFEDYRDSGLRVSRPVGAQTPPPSGMVKFPDNNSFPGDAVIQHGSGNGIPRDPRTGQPTQRVPVFVHPDIYDHIKGVLDSTAPKSALLRGILKLSGGAKSMLLSLSPFHWNTMITRALEAGMNPMVIGRNLHRATYLEGSPKLMMGMPRPIDYENLTKEQQYAIDSGVVVSNTRPGHSDFLEEGNVVGHHSWAAKMPLIGGFNRWIEGRLFGPQGFITGLKFDLHDQMVKQIKSSMPTLDDTVAGRIAASRINNKFGGLNYTLMGRSASTQNALRAMLLAPDFLESTGRSVMDVAGKNGMPLVKSLIAFNLAHYLLARTLNYVANGNLHPESGFQVIGPDGKREYGIRTTLGDFLHFAEHPRDFMMNRVNPLLVRTPLELLGGVDAQGNKVSDTQKMWDTVRQIMPIPAQVLTPKQQISQPSGWDEGLKAVGVGSVKRFSPAETLAYQRSTQRSQGAPLEGDALEAAQTKYKLEDDLRNSVQAKDAAGIKTGKTAIIKARVAGQITVPEETKLILDAYKFKTRLAATIVRLPLDDALDVYKTASNIEKKQIRTAVLQKVQSYYNSVNQGKKPIGEFRSLKPRIQTFLADRP